jgi:hypothetical protein
MRIILAKGRMYLRNFEETSALGVTPKVRHDAIKGLDLLFHFGIS